MISVCKTIIIHSNTKNRKVYINRKENSALREEKHKFNSEVKQVVVDEDESALSTRYIP